MSRWELNKPINGNFNLFCSLCEIKKSYKKQGKKFLSLLMKGVKYNERL